MPEALITCTKCKKRTPMSQMRYSPDGEDLVCETCARPGMAGSKDKKDNIAPVARGVTASMPSMSRLTPAATGSVVLSSAAAASKTIRYHCTSCNYSFSRASRNEIACPYCNKKTLRRESPLVSDVDELMGNLNMY